MEANSFVKTKMYLAELETVLAIQAQYVENILKPRYSHFVHFHVVANLQKYQFAEAPFHFVQRKTFLKLKTLLHSNTHTIHSILGMMVMAKSTC